MVNCSRDVYIDDEGSYTVWKSDECRGLYTYIAGKHLYIIISSTKRSPPLVVTRRDCRLYASHTYYIPLLCSVYIHLYTLSDVEIINNNKNRIDCI